MSLLTQQDHDFFEENGYIVVPNAVPQENLDDAIRAVCAFQNIDLENPQTWYAFKPQYGLIHIHQHQALWNNRQHPKLYQIFCEIYGRHDLWVSMDRASFKPPYHPDHPEHDGKGFMHWDIDTNHLPKALGVQGVLSLTDTDADMGGFQCIPGFHRNLEAWIAEQPEDRDPRHPDLSRLPEGMQPTPIPTKAGDIIIWDMRLAHGNGRNVGTRPRLAQYITMYPADTWGDPLEDRIAAWRERRPPRHWEGDPREIEQKSGVTATLTPLGKKLLGLEPWGETPHGA